MAEDLIAAQLQTLRVPFPPEQIGKLPKAGMQLDYVGHADVTARLLDADARWSWEPMATDDAGLPVLDRFGNLWIRLTVCGVTRPGVGDGKSMKECISDALRNAAMRFGVALDLWAKGDRDYGGIHGHDAPAQPQKGGADLARDELRELCADKGLDLLQVAQDYADGHDGKPLKDARENDVRRFIALVRSGIPTEDVVMSRQMKREHNALVKEVLAVDGKAERLPANPADDPFYLPEGDKP